MGVPFFMEFAKYFVGFIALLLVGGARFPSECPVVL
jgi:hypothetical protein